MITEDFCDVGDSPSYSCHHCRPDGPVPPTVVERTAAIVRRIERREALTTITPVIPTPMDFADWAESVTSRPDDNGKLERGNA